MAAAYKNGAARLAIVGEDPSLLAKEDPDKVSRANRARSKAYMPALNMIAGFDINWTIVSAATPAWAKAVFPDDPEEVAVAKLWEAIFAASRVDTPDPIAAWETHNAALQARTRLLNEQELCGAALPRPRHGSARRPRRRSRMERRLDRGEERHRLQRQHSDRGGLHHAAQGPGRRHRHAAPSRSPTTAR